MGSVVQKTKEIDYPEKLLCMCSKLQKILTLSSILMISKIKILMKTKKFNSEYINFWFLLLGETEIFK